jgi:hypothetical protein
MRKTAYREVDSPFLVWTGRAVVEMIRSQRCF